MEWEGVGRAHCLPELRRRHSGGTFNAADFNAAASAIGVDLPGLVGDWLNETALPGFMASRARVVRLTDDDQGRPRYETTLHVRNGEPVAGLVRLSHGRFSRSFSDPIRIPGNTAVEVGHGHASPPGGTSAGTLPGIEQTAGANRNSLRPKHRTMRIENRLSALGQVPGPPPSRGS